METGLVLGEEATLASMDPEPESWLCPLIMVAVRLAVPDGLELRLCWNSRPSRFIISPVGAILRTGDGLLVYVSDKGI